LEKNVSIFSYERKDAIVIWIKSKVTIFSERGVTSADGPIQDPLNP